MFERYSFPWKQVDKKFTEEETSELENIFKEGGTSISAEELKNKFMLDFCKVDKYVTGSKII